MEDDPLALAGLQVHAAEGDKIIDWEIEYNTLALVAAGGTTITDRISETADDYMKYYGSGITVKAYDRSGQLAYSADVSYSELSAYSDTSWKYTIPTTHTEPWRYVITYQTIVNMEKVDGEGVVVILDNTANHDGGTIQVAPEEMIAVVKTAEAFSTEEITWNTTLSIPQDGLTKAVVTDYLPRIYLEEGNFYDVLKDGSLEITGLLPGESYLVDYGVGMVTITFYKDAVPTEGLLPFPGGRHINVKLTTLVDQDWLQKGYEAGGYEQKHINTINLNGVSDTATVIFGKPGITKTGETADEKVFKFTLLVSGLQEEPFTITDSFDTSLLEVVTDGSEVDGWSWDHMRLFGGSQDSQIAGRIPVSYTDTGNGIVITANAVPKDEDGHFYPYYRIVYYLKLKDGVDLTDLAIANGGEYDLVNKAIWADHETEFTYKVKYQGNAQRRRAHGNEGRAQRQPESGLRIGLYRNGSRRRRRPLFDQRRQG